MAAAAVATKTANPAFISTESPPATLRTISPSDLNCYASLAPVTHPYATSILIMYNVYRATNLGKRKVGRVQEYLKKKRIIKLTKKNTVLITMENEEFPANKHYNSRFFYNILKGVSG